jgi:hypothetical protein
MTATTQVAREVWYWGGDDNEYLHCVCNSDDIRDLGRQAGIMVCGHCDRVADFVDNDEGGEWVVRQPRVDSTVYVVTEAQQIEAARVIATMHCTDDALAYAETIGSDREFGHVTGDDVRVAWAIADMVWRDGSRESTAHMLQHMTSVTPLDGCTECATRRAQGDRVRAIRRSAAYAMSDMQMYKTTTVERMHILRLIAADEIAAGTEARVTVRYA